MASAMPTRASSTQLSRWWPPPTMQGSISVRSTTTRVSVTRKHHWSARPHIASPRRSSSTPVHAIAVPSSRSSALSTTGPAHRPSTPSRTGHTHTSAPWQVPCARMALARWNVRSGPPQSVIQHHLPRRGRQAPRSALLSQRRLRGKERVSIWRRLRRRD
jgi:hypothetical protein